jgi:hypothetical protein
MSTSRYLRPRLGSTAGAPALAPFLALPFFGRNDLAGKVSAGTRQLVVGGHARSGTKGYMQAQSQGAGYARRLPGGHIT